MGGRGKQASLMVMMLMLMLMTIRDGGCALNSEGVLEKALFANYSKNVRPSTNSQDPLTVVLGYSLGKIEQLNERKQMMISFGWLLQAWIDPELAWNPDDHDGIDVLIIPSENIWKPEMAVLNSMENLEDLSYHDKSRLRVSPSGEVDWLQGLRWTTECTMDLTFFPFDTQECQVVFISWVYSIDMIRHINAGNVSLDAFVPNGEWALLGSSIFHDSLLEADGENIPILGFTLILKRIPTYFIFNILLPVAVLSSLSLVAYILPAEAGEKIGLQITILLAFSVMLLLMSDNTPKAGSTTPILTIYICAIMCQLAASLIISAWLLNIYHHRPEVAPPHWLQALARCLEQLLCTSYRSPRPRGRPKRGKGHTRSSPLDSQSLYQPRVHALPQEVALPEEVRIYLIKKMEDDKEAAILDASQRQWQNISRILERLFFIVFSIFVILITSMVIVNLKN